MKAKLIKKYFKKINFEEVIKNDIIKSKTIVEGNSKLNLLTKNDNGLLLLKNTFILHNNKSKSFIKIDHFFPKYENPKYENNKYNSKGYINTDTFSVTSQKKRSQQELIRKTRANFTSEENAENTKLSSIFVKKYKENISHISQINNIKV